MIVDPEVWDAVQTQLQSDSDRPRGRNRDRLTSASPLASKLFGESGVG